MPFKSKKQKHFMEAVAHGIKPKKKGLSQATAKKLVKDDKRAKKRKRG